MKNKVNSRRKPRNRVALFYKSHGVFIGPYTGVTVSKTEARKMKEDGTLSLLSNYVLRSPIQLRRRVK